MPRGKAGGRTWWVPVGLAAILENALPKEHQRVGIVLSGGNVDPTIFAEILYSA